MMSDRPYSKYCLEHSLPLPAADVEEEINHAIFAIAREDPDNILQKMYAIYEKFPPIDEGIHQLEEMGTYEQELLQLGLLHQDLNHIIANRIKAISIEKSMFIWRIIRSTYEKMRMLEPKM